MIGYNTINIPTYLGVHGFLTITVVFNWLCQFSFSIIVVAELGQSWD